MPAGSTAPSKALVGAAETGGGPAALLMPFASEKVTTGGKNAGGEHGPVERARGGGRDGRRAVVAADAIGCEDDHHEGKNSGGEEGCDGTAIHGSEPTEGQLSARGRAGSGSLSFLK